VNWQIAMQSPSLNLANICSIAYQLWPYLLLNDFAKSISRQIHYFNKSPNIISANICSYTVYSRLINRICFNRLLIYQSLITKVHERRVLNLHITHQKWSCKIPWLLIDRIKSVLIKCWLLTYVQSASLTKAHMSYKFCAAWALGYKIPFHNEDKIKNLLGD